MATSSMSSVKAIAAWPKAEAASIRARRRGISQRGAYENADKTGADAPLPARPHLGTTASARAPTSAPAADKSTATTSVKDFGFRGVEFGNWVASDERQKVVNLAYDGLHDMGGILGVPAEGAGASTGSSAWRSAHRRGPWSRRRPLRASADWSSTADVETDRRGLASARMGHALDHYFGTLDTPESTRGAPKGPQAGMTAPSSGQAFI